MEILLYSHCGSRNHGCEALVRSFAALFKNSGMTVYSFDKESDELYNVNEIIKIENSGINKKDKFFQWFVYSVLYRIKVIDNSQKLYCNLYKCSPNSVALSVGGDNYCYPELLKELVYVNKKLRQRGVRTILAGCSIEPDLLMEENKELINDLKGYDAIIARESITYNALLKCKIDKNVFLCPDIAFTLEPKYDKFSQNLKKNCYVGINISPMILDYCENPTVVVDNYYNLVHHVLDDLNLDVLLIPHVTAEGSNDLNVIAKIKEKFPTDRVIVVGDQDSQRLKGIIGKCRFFVGARTHSTIAAYSLGVPTLVVGYSVKAKGIALDIFGEYEHYVVPVWQLKNDGDLLEKFLWLKENEDNIRSYLENKMISYIDAARSSRGIIDKILE